MTGHRERLIKAGLYVPLDSHDIAERDEILQRAKKGEKVKEKPCHCVIRVDGAYKQLWHPDEEERCHDAELIAEKLYSWEAWRLVNLLERKDDQQPKAPGGWVLGLYRICSVDDWAAWEAEHSQLMLDV